MRNLKLEELFIGAWVQVFMEIPQKMTPPMQVCGIFKGGDLYLDIDGNEGDPFEAVIGETCPLPIDDVVLRHFGFIRTKGDNVWLKKFGDIRLTASLRQRGGQVLCRRVALSGRIACWNEEIRNVHELQRWWTEKVLLPYGTPFVLEWKDEVKEIEELG